MREIQYFERENISMTRPTLDISPSRNGKDQFTISPLQNGKMHFTISSSQNGKEHFTILPIDSIPVKTKTPDPPPLTRPMEFP